MARPSWAAVAGLIVGGIATVVMWQYTDRLSQRNLDEEFSQRVSHATLAVDRTLDELTGTLQTIRSVVETTGELDQATFERVLKQRAQRLFHTGLQYVGLSYAARPGEADCSATDLSGELTLCLNMGRVYPVATNEQTQNMSLVSDKVRRAAISRAIDTGYVSATAPLPFAADNIASPGLIVYLPVYRRFVSLASIEARRQALLAVAAVSFSLEDIVRAELGAGFFRSLGFRILDRGLVSKASLDDRETQLVLDGPALLRDSGAKIDLSEPVAMREFQRGFAGREWSYRFEMPAPPASDASVAAPRLTLVLGMLSTLLLAVFLQFVSRARSRAEGLAREMTRHLQQSENQLRLALDAAQMGAWSWDSAQRQFNGDARARDLLPIDVPEFSRLFNGFDAADQVKANAAVENALAGNGILSIEARLGSRTLVRHIELVAHLSADDDGNLAAGVGLVRDISERKEQARGQRRLLNQLVTAEEQERRRIARELHDQLGQEITAISLGLKHLEGLDDEPVARADLLKRLREIVQAIDERVDRFMLDLRPVVLDDLGLDAALQAQLEQWSEVHGIQVNSHIAGSGEDALPFEVATTAFRLVQESLTNVARHSLASVVDVIVESSHRDLRVVIEDNGHGAEEPLNPRRHGLAGMRERVESLGGEFRVESSPGKGFSVFARIPIPETIGTV